MPPASPTALLETLRAAGFMLSRAGAGAHETLRVAPAARLTPALREAIRVHRAELLALLPPAGGSEAGVRRTSPAGLAPARAEPTSRLDFDDPRPDLASDTAPWRCLLRWAFILDGESADGAFGALHGVRCCGARLERWGAVSGTWRIVPGAEYLGGGVAWASDRVTLLLPRRAAVARLLQGLTERWDGRVRRAARTTCEHGGPRQGELPAGENRATDVGGMTGDAA